MTIESSTSSTDIEPAPGYDLTGMPLRKAPQHDPLIEYVIEDTDSCWHRRMSRRRERSNMQNVDYAHLKSRHWRR